MKRSEALEHMNRLETEFDVNSWQLGGVALWPWLRIQLGFALSDGNSGVKAHPSRSPLLLRLVNDCVQHVKLSLWDRTHQQSFHKQADILFLARTDSRQCVAGIWHDRLCDPIIDQLARQNSVSVWERPQLGAYRLPRAKPSAPFRLPFLIAKYSGQKRVITLNDRDFTGEYERALATLPLQGASAKAMQWHVQRKHMLQIHAFADIFEAWLKRNQAKAVMQVCYYSDIGMAINLACHRLGIASFDIQHGIQGDHHIAYARWNQVPTHGYELLPKQFLVWSDVEKKVIDAWCAKSSHHQSWITGNPWLDKWRFGSDPAILELDQKVNDVKTRFQAQKAILVTLQPKYDTIKDLEFITQLYRQVEGDVLWLIRLHPLMANRKSLVKQFIKKNKLSRAEVEQATALPLYAWLRNIDVHATAFSTVVREAAEFGVPSLVWSKDGNDYFAKEISEGLAKWGGSQNQCVSILNDFLNRGLKGKTPKGPPVKKSAFAAISDLIRA